MYSQSQLGMQPDLHTSGFTRRNCLSAIGLLATGLAAGNTAYAAAGTKGRSDAQPHNAGSDSQLKGAADAAPIRVAVVLGPNATLIDFAGPWEVLGSAAYSSPGFNVYSVAATREPISCDDGRSTMSGSPASALRVIPDFTFEDAPRPRIVVMGAQGGDDEHKLEWIRQAARHADLTASVCTGAFLLAKTGLLDGKAATTNRGAYDSFEKSFPKVKLVRGVRFVDSGSVATATGLTAGVDLALHIIERFYGRAVAQQVADYEEWHSDGWLGQHS